MDKNTTITNAGGISFVGVLTIVFIVLKLTGVINWSWLWVLSPIWIPVLLILFIVFVAAVIIAVKQKENSRK